MELHGVDNKVHVTGREAGADPGFWAQTKSTLCMQRIIFIVYSGRESFGSGTSRGGGGTSNWVCAIFETPIFSPRSQLDRYVLFLIQSDIIKCEIQCNYKKDIFNS